jgi:hypothetical protein
MVSLPTDESRTRGPIDRPCRAKWPHCPSPRSGRSGMASGGVCVTGVRVRRCQSRTRSWSGAARLVSAEHWSSVGRAGESSYSTRQAREHRVERDRGAARPQRRRARRAPPRRARAAGGPADRRAAGRCRGRCGGRVRAARGEAVRREQAAHARARADAWAELRAARRCRGSSRYGARRYSTARSATDGRCLTAP